MQTSVKTPTFFTYGVGTARYKSFVLLSSEEILIALGPNICLYSLNSFEKRVLAVSDSVIMTVLPLNLLEKRVVTVSYNGEVAVADLKKWQILWKTQCQGDCVRHASVFQEKLLVCAEEFQEFKGLSQVFDVKSGEKHEKQPFSWKIAGRFRFGELLDAETVFVLKKNPLKSSEFPDKSLKTSSSKGPGNKKKLFNYFMELYDMGFPEEKRDFPIKSAFLPEICEIIATSLNETRELLALLYANRRVLVVNARTLSRVFEVNFQGNGCIMSLSFQEKSRKNLVICPKTDKLLIMDCETLEKTKIPENFLVEDEFCAKFQGFTLLQPKKSGEALDQGNFFGVLLGNSQKYVSFNGEGLHLLDFGANSSRTHAMASLTHCGLALNSKETLVCAGDFLGNVLIFSTNDEFSEPVFATNVGGGVRSLSFCEFSGNFPANVLIGTMDGAIYQWFFTEFSEFPTKIASLQGSVTSLRTFQGDCEGFFLAGTTQGSISVFSKDFLSNCAEFSEEIRVQAHSAQEPCDKEAFGSLEKYAETWSCAWDPRSCKEKLGFATCSEDQSCKIWQFSRKIAMNLKETKGNCEETKGNCEENTGNCKENAGNLNNFHENFKESWVLTGHTRAVTCVDWQNTSVGELLATCSDDRTVRIYAISRENCEISSFSLRKVVTTEFVKDWFTLTYLSFQRNAAKVAISAQNGYLFVYNLEENRFEFAKRTHLGSVEGLAFGEYGKVATCAADLTVQVADFNEN